MLNDKVPSIVPAFEQNNVPVGVVADNLFAPYAGVFIRSLLDYASKENNYDIIVFEHEMSTESKRLLKSLAEGHENVSIRFYDPTPIFILFKLDCENGVSRWPNEVLCKIIFPHLINCSGRVITVDVDTLLKTDVARLMDEDLAGHSVGGVCSALTNGMYLCDHVLYRSNTKMRDYVQDVLGFSSDDFKSYISAGILLFDRDKYVQELSLKTILDTARRGKYIFPEQDVLNVLMKGRIKALDFAWNVVITPDRINTKYLDAGSKLYGGACERAYENPYMLHWGSRPKPWVCPDVPLGNEWWQAALRTPFVGHIIARMVNELETRRTYFRNRYGIEADVWDPSPKGTG